MPETTQNNKIKGYDYLMLKGLMVVGIAILCANSIAAVSSDLLTGGSSVSAFLTAPQSPNWNPDDGFNGDHVINFDDFATFPEIFLMSPGPSAIAL